MTDVETFEVDADTPFGYLEGIPAEFDIEVEEYPAEPYSWGESRGMERAASARFLKMNLGELTLRENEACAVFGREVVSAWEDRVVEEILEREWN